MMRSLLTILVCFSVFAGCSHSTPKPSNISYSRKQIKTLAEPRSPNSVKSYVSIEVDLSPFAEIRQEVETREKISLKHRGEAHITLITPPEMKALKKHLTTKDIHRLIEKTQVMKSKYELLCVGKATLKNDSTYFVVINAEDLFKFRKTVEDEFTAKGGSKTDFDHEAFSPHITLGFTKKDLHREEGAVKDASSCLYMLKGR